MAESLHGTAYVFGVTGTITEAAVQSFQPKKSFQNVTQVMDESGNQVSDRSDDRITDATITLKHTSTYVVESIGAILTFNAIKYWVVDTDESETNTDHKEVSYTLKNTEFIALV